MRFDKVLPIAADCRAQWYHGPRDEFDENWDWSGIMQDLQLFYRPGRMPRANP